MTREDMLEIKSLMEEVVAPMKEDIRALREDVSGLKGDVNSLKSEMEEVKGRLTRVELTQENIIVPQIQLLAEGHQNILDHIDEKIAESVGGLSDRVEVLEVVVRQHSRDISELKKAQ